MFFIYKKFFPSSGPLHVMFSQPVMFLLFSLFWALLQSSVSHYCFVLSPSSSVMFCNSQTISEFLGYISGLEAGTLIMAWPILSKLILIVQLHHGFYTYPVFLFTTSFFLLQFAKTHFSLLRFCYEWCHFMHSWSCLRFPKTFDCGL